MRLRLRRLMPGLLAVLVVLALAPSSFAQVQITLTPTPSPNEIQTSHAAQTSDPSTLGAGVLVTGALLANSPLTTTVLAFTYPVTITSSSVNCDIIGTTTSLANVTGLPGSACANGLIPPEDPIAIVGATGVFANVQNLKLNTNLKRVEIDLPGFPASTPNSSSGSFRITGIRVDMNGASAPVTATGSLGNAANNYLLSTPSFNAVNGTAAGIASVAIGARTGQVNQGTAAILTNNTSPKQSASILITGGFAGAFRNRSQLSNSGLSLNNAKENSTQIQLTFGSIPTGVTLNLTINGTTAQFCVSAGCNGVTGAGISQTTTVTSTANTALLEMTGTSLTTTPTIEVDINSIVLTSTAATKTPGAITMTASMAPFCTAAVDTAGYPTLANGYPCFTEAEVGPVTVVNIIPVSTTMLMPYALTTGSGGYDTGIAIANTTADPFVSTGGSATPTSGTLKLDFFPTATSTGGAGTPFSLSTSSTVKPGTGLSSDGTLAAGATWTVLLSSLLQAASVTGNFQGYIFITANFLDAHGTATISDFRTYSLTANVLVMPPPSTVTRATPPGGVEALHY